MIDEFQKRVLEHIKIKTVSDLMGVLDIILPGHSVDEDQESQLIIYTGLIEGTAGELWRTTLPAQKKEKN
jgi:hypothetical protein